MNPSKLVFRIALDMLFQTDDQLPSIIFLAGGIRHFSCLERISLAQITDDSAAAVTWTLLTPTNTPSSEWERHWSPCPAIQSHQPSFSCDITSKPAIQFPFKKMVHTPNDWHFHGTHFDIGFQGLTSAFGQTTMVFAFLLYRCGRVCRSMLFFFLPWNTHMWLFSSKLSTCCFPCLFSGVHLDLSLAGREIQTLGNDVLSNPHYLGVAKQHV